MKGGQDRGRGQGKTMICEKKKRFKFKDRETLEFYSCKKIGHWKRDCPNKSGNSSSSNIVQYDGSYIEEDLLCVSSTK